MLAQMWEWAHFSNKIFSDDPTLREWSLLNKAVYTPWRSQKSPVSGRKLETPVSSRQEEAQRGLQNNLYGQNSHPESDVIAQREKSQIRVTLTFTLKIKQEKKFN